MTEAQRERLPEILREIVDCDRRIATVRAGLAQPVLAASAYDPLATFRMLRVLRRELTERASGLYGYQLRGSDPTHA